MRSFASWRTKMLKRILSIAMVSMLFLCMLALGCCEGTAQIKIQFDYQHMHTIASNQFAVWVEDAEGNLVKTLYVTGFTGSRRGYRNRDMSLPKWVGVANPEEMSDEEIDGISGATPSQGTLAYTWALTTDRGETVMDGVYHVYVEGALFWESEVLFSAGIDLSQLAPGGLEVSVDRNNPEQSDNEDMLTNVEIEIL